MGTRSLVHIKDGKKTIATLYRQYDGYPTGMGNAIKEALNDGNVTILNGFGGQTVPSHFNGMGCLGAFLIGELKEKKIGNVYMFPVNSKDVGEEFVYTLSEVDGKVKLKVTDSYENKVIFNGMLKDFDGKTVEGISNDQEIGA